MHTNTLNAVPVSPPAKTELQNTKNHFPASAKSSTLLAFVLQERENDKAMCKPGHMCAPLSSHVFHISAPLSDTATTSQVLIKPAPPLLPGRTTGLSLLLHPRDGLKDDRTQQIPVQITGVCISSASTKENTERISRSRAQYLCPLCTSPLHFPVDIPAPRMVCGDADKLLRGKWTDFFQNTHCST